MSTNGRQAFGPDDDRLLKTVEVAARFGVARNTIVQWTHDALLTSLRTPGGQLRFRARDIQRLLEQVDHGGKPRRQDGPQLPADRVSAPEPAEPRNAAPKKGRRGRRRARRNERIDEVIRRLSSIEAALSAFREPAGAAEDTQAP